MQNHDLAGYTVAVPETRELDVFVAMLERRGARALRCPLVAIKDAPDPAPVLQWIAWFCQGPCDDLILLTGEGLRRLLACIDQHAPHQREPFLARLAAVRTITRGPKPGRVLRTLGLKADCIADSPTTQGVISTLQREDLQGRIMGVQLYGSEVNQPLQDFLAAAGATLHTVAPYVYADAIEQAQVIELIDRITRREVDAIAFTSMAQVQRLFRVARDSERESPLQEGLRAIAVAAVGPVVADSLREHGCQVDAMPGESFFLKPMTGALAELLAQQRGALSDDDATMPPAEAHDPGQS
ncbi:uroporphyrinogen-III synthase [Algiphilus sp.]|uniref:uroporphyrinogen-III synthase n=1 Tax=Algiphilus sp. TaxID=1872431 RepID=UPI0032ED4E23